MKQAHINTVTKPIEKLIPHPKNPNTHDDRQIGKLRHLIRTHGYAKGSVVYQLSTGYILAGHGIVEALKKEGYTHVDTVELDIDDAKAESFMIADNKIASDSVIDDSSLQQLITQLSEQDVPSLNFGFDGKDLEDLASRILANSGGYTPEPQDDEIPEEVEPITQTGDLWTLGKHKVLCGDSTKAEDVERLMDGEKADMVFTDPPYGINIVKGIGNIEGAKEFGRLGQKGGKSVGVVGGKGVIKPRLYHPIIGDDKPFDPSFLLNLAPVIILFGANHYASKLPDSPAWLIWDKGVSPDSTFSACELIWTNKGNHVRRYEYRWSGMIRAGIREEELKDRVHPTQKPVGLCFEMLNNYEGNIILDLFLGSGSTLIACQKLNRVCYGMEIDQHYCDVIVKRYIDFVGDDSSVSCLRNGQVIGYKELSE